MPLLLNNIKFTFLDLEFDAYPLYFQNFCLFPKLKVLLNKNFQNVIIVYFSTFKPKRNKQVWNRLSNSTWLSISATATATGQSKNTIVA